MKKLFTLLFFMVGLFPGWLSAQIEGVEPPLNPEYVEYMEKLERGEIELRTEEGYYTGAVPPKYLLFSPEEMEGLEPSPRRLKAVPLPERFDLRDEGRVTPAKDQGGCGNNWVFAAMSALESNLLTDGYGSWDLAEDQFMDCLLPARLCSGGNPTDIRSLLISGFGPLFEKQDPYTPYLMDCPPKKDPAVLVTEFRTLQTNSKDEIKKLIMKEGAVSYTIAWGGGSWYGPVFYPPPVSNQTHSWHSFALVGWDDNYPTRYGKGVWIAKSSWGENWGENGFFYFVQENDPANMQVDYMPNFLSAMEYEVLTYIHPFRRWAYTYRLFTSETSTVTKFTAESDLELTSIGTFLTPTLKVSAKVFKEFDGIDLKKELGKTSIFSPPYFFDFQTGEHSHERGNFTLPLEQSIQIPSGETFYVEVSYSSPPHNYFAILVDPYQEDLESGVSWIKPAGETWKPIGKGTGYHYDLYVQVYAKTPKSYFTLVNSQTDQDIRPLSDNDLIDLDETGDKLNIRPDFPNEEEIGSVVFFLNGKKVRTENTPPYALAGDDPKGDYLDWTPEPGTYTLEAIPYPHKGGKGEAGTSRRITFDVRVTPRVFDFAIVNAETDADVDPVIAYTPEEGIIQMPLPAYPINIRAEAFGAGSVVFYLNGQKFRTENEAPFSLAGDKPPGDYLEWFPEPGRYTIRAVPYTLDRGKGEEGEAAEVELILTEGYFTLVNSYSDRDIRQLLDNDLIEFYNTSDFLNIRANFLNEEKIGSVVFYLNGKKVRTENRLPFALAGDKPTGNYLDWTPEPGTYTLEAVPYTRKKGRGEAGNPLRITFEVSGLPEVVHFRVVNADTDNWMPLSPNYNRKLASFVHGIRLSTYPINVQALALRSESVVFYINGQKFRTENEPPFALAGDDPTGDYLGWFPEPGVYTIEAVPYTRDGGKGVKGIGLHINLSITWASNSMVSGGNSDRGLEVKIYPENSSIQDAHQSEHNSAKESGAEAISLENLRPGKVFPNPTSGKVQLSLDPEIRLPLSVRIFDPLGRLVEYLPEIHSNQINLDLDKYRASDGLFLIEWANGEGRGVHRVLKMRN